MIFLRLLRDERGATLAVTAVMIAGLLAMMALAIDLGMLRTARAEAQRAADAAALAGAQEFLHVTPASAAVGPARAAALAFARMNGIRNVQIDSSEVTIQVIPADQKVWVRIERQGIGLWFAKFVGRTQGTVAAAAAAAAMPAGAAKCVAPWAVPDMWHDTGDDADNDRVWDQTEHWEFGDDPGDYYQRFNNNPTSVPPETGYGSAWRNGNGSGVTNDFGMAMILKVQNPLNAPVSGFFYPFRIGTNTGANDYSNAIENCDPQVVPLNTNVPLEMGNMVGPTRQGVNNLVAQDPTAYWDPVAGVVSTYGLNSPRIKIVPLYDPAYIAQIVGGNHNLIFNNFALIFVEGVQKSGKDEFVIGRFLYFAQGVGGGAPGGATGSLVRVLQLVE